MAFVRGPDGQPLHNVVERVCFVLHDSFGDNKERSNKIIYLYHGIVSNF